MPEIHKWNSDGEATAYWECDYCGMALMKHVEVKNEKGDHLHVCVDCDKDAYLPDIHPYRDPAFDKI